MRAMARTKQRDARDSTEWKWHIFCESGRRCRVMKKPEQINLPENTLGKNLCYSDCCKVLGLINYQANYVLLFDCETCTTRCAIGSTDMTELWPFVTTGRPRRTALRLAHASSAFQNNPIRLCDLSLWTPILLVLMWWILLPHYWIW